jgi:transcriptional regulator with XRE-family HTH domain
VATEPIFEAARLLGERVRARRVELKLSQEGLDAVSGVHWSYIGQLERGARNPTLKTVLRLAHALRVDPGELMAGLPVPESDDTGDDEPPVRGRRG